jgi:putative transposase
MPNAGHGCSKTTSRKTTMTKDMMDVRSLVEKNADADLLREMIGFAAADRLMEMEVGSATGPEFGEKNPMRLAQRNGYRDRDWETRAGAVELRIPKLWAVQRARYMTLEPSGE